jgi:RNA processing factor Prp31
MIRTIKDVEEEINKYNKLLLEWANNLPDINERND